MDGGWVEVFEWVGEEAFGVACLRCGVAFWSETGVSLYIALDFSRFYIWGHMCTYPCIAQIFEDKLKAKFDA